MNQGMPITLTDEQRNELDLWVRSKTLDARSVRQACILLAAAEGCMAAIQPDLPRIDAAEIVHVTTQKKLEGATRKLAAKLPFPDVTVLKVCQAHGLKPHPVETFKISRDPKLVEKLEDIVVIFRNVQETVSPIKEYVALHNEDPKPFVSAAKASSILQKVIRANRLLGSKKNEALH